MLQQTQVERVKLKYVEWLELFPDWEALASASNAQVIGAWAGLGYNRRALMLRDVARVVVERGVPQTREEWMLIKGIGPYTSAAVSAFAQKRRVLPIDTNIRRVLGRVLLGVPFPDLSDDEQIEALAGGFLPRRGAYYDVPQAIFDLATMVCTKTPDCGSCPLRSVCPLADAFIADEIAVPKRTIKKANERVHRDKRYPDRIFRGRIVTLLRGQGSVIEAELGAIIDSGYDDTLDRTWVTRMIDRLVRDRMVERDNGTLILSRL